MVKTIMKNIGIGVWKGMDNFLLAFPRWFWPVIFIASLILLVLELTGWIKTK